MENQKMISISPLLLLPTAHYSLLPYERSGKSNHHNL